MRAQAMENLLKLMVKYLEQSHGNDPVVKNYCTKARVLLDREGNGASVIRELVNQRVDL